MNWNRIITSVLYDGKKIRLPEWSDGWVVEAVPDQKPIRYVCKNRKTGSMKILSIDEIMKDTWEYVE